MIYRTLETYRDGNLSHLWTRGLFTLRDADPKLSSQRAGELAAAKIAAQAGREYTQLEEVLKFNAGEGTYLAVLYDWLINHEDIKRVLTAMSRTRTLLVDMEAYQTPRFHVGDQVRIKAGNCAGLVVTVTHVSRTDYGSWFVEHDLHGLPYYEEAVELVSRNQVPITPSPRPALEYTSDETAKLNTFYSGIDN
jgi:hypothetical protein